MCFLFVGVVALLIYIGFKNCAETQNERMKYKNRIYISDTFAGKLSISGV